VPNPNKDLAVPVPGELICKNGIYNHEKPNFTGLIADRKYQFACLFSRRRQKANAPASPGAFCLRICATWP
jgi:hypothetical protein